MEDITVKLTKFCLNYHPSGVKMLAKFTQLGIPVLYDPVKGSKGESSCAISISF